VTASPWSRRSVAYGLLALVVLFGGYLRFVGLNWDDFSGSHPDERFLTMNLLPLVGGGLEFTNDPNNFPPQRLLTRANSGINRAALMNDAELTLGVLRGAKSETFAHYLVLSGRVAIYGDPETALSDLVGGRVDAVLVDTGVPLNLLPVMDGRVSSFEQITSEEIQRARCAALYPETMGVGGYFDARCSNLNPHNSGAGFYAYGTLPLFMAYAGVQAHRELERIAPTVFEWPGQAVIWRFLSAFFDVGTILFVFFAGARLHNRWTGLLAALLYAAAPLPIQKAHFGTVNAITAFWVALALWAAVGVQDRGRHFYYAVFGMAYGFALAGRINLLPLVGVVGLAMIVYTLPALDRTLPTDIRGRMLTRAVSGLLLAGLTAALAFRVANPYAFQGPGFFGLLPNDRFLADIASAQFGVSGASDAPPNYQWVGRMDYVYPLKDIFLWGVGIAPALLAWFGWAWAGWQLIARRLGATRNLFLFAWVLVYFGFMGQQWVMTMRYFLPLYSAFALLGGWAIVELVRRSAQGKGSVTRVLLTTLGVPLLLIPTYYAANGLALTPTAITAGVMGAVLGVGALLLRPVWRARLLGAFTVGFAVLWGLMFTNIYRNDLTRVEASRWVFEQISSDFSMRIEGAPAGTPLINIALPNMNPNSALNAADLLNGASRLFVNQPYLMEFVAPADGVILEVFAPHIGALNATGEPHSLYVSISSAVSAVICSS
jgi:4-amino-4-deoxy-L-arabinose transferase-like glycosyltransferase